MLTVTDGKPRQPYRLIVDDEKDRMDVLTIQLSTGGEALPVFSHEEEAEEFVRLESPGTGWRTRETSIRELVSVLLGPCAGVAWVALDPWPGIHGEMVVGLIGLNRLDFVNLLVGGIEASRSTARGHALEHSRRPILRCSPGSERRHGHQHPAEPAQAEIARNV
jgi:hypothetical protein